MFESKEKRKKKEYKGMIRHFIISTALDRDEAELVYDYIDENDLLLADFIREAIGFFLKEKQK